MKRYIMQNTKSLETGIIKGNKKTIIKLDHENNIFKNPNSKKLKSKF